MRKLALALSLADAPGAGQPACDGSHRRALSVPHDCRIAENWKFSRTKIQAADGSHVVVKDSRNVTGLEGP